MKTTFTKLAFILVLALGFSSSAFAAYTITSAVAATTSYPQEGTAVINVTYTADAQCDLIIDLYSQTPWGKLTTITKTVEAAATATTIVVNVPIPSTAAVSWTFIKPFLTTVGGTWDTRLAKFDGGGFNVTSPTSVTPAGTITSAVAATNSYPQGGTAVVKVKYTSNVACDIMIELYSQIPWGLLTKERKTLPIAATETEVSVNVSIPTSSAISWTMIKPYLTTVGGLWANNFVNMTGGGFDVIAGTTKLGDTNTTSTNVYLVDRNKLAIATPAHSAVALYNISGAEVMTLKTTESVSKLDVSMLKAGVYLVKISSNGKSEIKKVLLN